ncbi:WAT1-related protein At1g43650-like [Coffea arabica]|uniref:WAT1-related protein n=1 Tax=Coffea arabica TaxID=13443 RepID=A0A6P6ULD8_COFAR|nr:WAT1-related protein At1g43650-like [Coffea arabica]
MESSIGCSKGLEKQKPYFVMFFVHIVYAGMALFSKAAISKGMNPYVFVAYRQGFATIALAPFAILLDRNKPAFLSYVTVCKIFFISLFGITLSLNLYAYAMNYTSATFAAAATNTIPATTFVMAILLRMESLSIKKRHGMAKVLGSLIGLSGAMVFAFVKGPQLHFMDWSNSHHQDTPSSNIKTTSQGQFVKGSLIMLLANTAWSAWLIILGLIVKEYPAKMRLTALQCLFSCLQSSVFALAMERDISSWKLGWDINLFSVAYCGVIVTGITYWMQLWAVDKKGPVFIAMFTPLGLIITAIVSVLAWKEMLHLGSVCGAILLVGGLYSVLWGKNQEAKCEGAAAKDQISEPEQEETGVVQVVVVKCNVNK